jgi:hypothetical protein
MGCMAPTAMRAPRARSAFDAIMSTRSPTLLM